MPRWFSKFQRSSKDDAGALPDLRDARALELLVVEGLDAGSRFTIDTREVRVGRGLADARRADSISLRDPSVSPLQALIRNLRARTEIEHLAEASQPTLVNGRPIDRETVTSGDRIQMGRVVCELRARDGLTLSGLVRIREALTAQTAIPAQASGTSITEVRAAAPLASLVLLEGVPGDEGREYPLHGLRNRVGRSAECEIVISEPGVSRRHAELVWEGNDLYLVHQSATNPTLVDGYPVRDRVALGGGARIQLANRVVLRVDWNASHRSLQSRLEEKLVRDQEIAEEFGFRGSFLDIDVVDSHGIKVAAESPEHIVIAFERFRSFARGVVEEFHGEVLNSNGDELMCFFEEPLHSIRAARALVDRLDAFNESENVIARPFRVRQGIHTGECLMDREHGVAYSPVVDVSGHLQKHAPENGVLVSDATLRSLPEIERPGFEAADPLEADGIATFRWSRG